MGWFKRKKDPISEKAQDLTHQIRQLEEQIHDLASKKESSPSLTEPPLPRSTPAVTREPSGVGSTGQPPHRSLRRDPVFEPLRHERLQDLTAPPAHYNELGVRKYDLPAAWKRLMDQLRSPTSRNPKLVDLLAAGSLQGIRPLRYEKRIARRRFLLVCAILFLLLWGLFAVLIH